MSSLKVPELLRATVARVPVRGVPRLLAGLTRPFASGGPGLCRIDSGDWLDLDLSDSDQCMMFYGLYSRGLAEVAQRFLRPGDTVWDIGGQLGYFANRFARMVGDQGTVVTFEPDPHSFTRLCRGLGRGNQSNIVARDCAITERCGEVSLRVSPTVGWSSLVEFDEPLLETVQVAGYSLDELVRRGELDPAGLRLIKMDIEGGELGALRGMRQTLADHEVVLICELNTAALQAGGATPDDLLAMLADLGLRSYAIQPPQGLVRSAAPDLVPIADARELPFSLGDLLCVPRGIELDGEPPA